MAKETATERLFNKDGLFSSGFSSRGKAVNSVVANDVPDEPGGEAKPKSRAANAFLDSLREQQ